MPSDDYVCQRQLSQFSDCVESDLLVLTAPAKQTATDDTCYTCCWRHFFLFFFFFLDWNRRAPQKKALETSEWRQEIICITFKRRVLTTNKSRSAPGVNHQFLPPHFWPSGDRWGSSRRAAPESTSSRKPWVGGNTRASKINNLTNKQAKCCLSVWTAAKRHAMNAIDTLSQSFKHACSQY